MKETKIKIPRLILYAAIAAAVIAADQVTKYAAQTALRDIETFPLIRGVLHLTYVENTGAAFGMLSDKRWVFMVLSSVALVAMAVFTVINRNGRMMTNVAVAMIFGGGVGNMIDRFASGFVVDFIDFRLINFWVFNVADSFVCIGCGVLILSLILGEIKSGKEKKTAGGEAGE
ncbi:MAG: signal peptidase II [Clostridia bacterium]|nr:signal peptidase II [Clostridia bacterium]